MSAITIRLDEKLEKLLNQELQLGEKSRSDLVREALQDYLASREQERLIQSMVQEMKNLSPEARQEGLEMAEDFLPLENEALSLAEGRKPYELPPEERWWK